jgi:hypothetical protein
MKNYKYIGLFLLSLGFTSCDVNNELDVITAEVEAEVALNTNGLDFSKYISVGASFTAGFTDGAMFKAGQENSFPNILAGKFGTDFKQPLMNDNIGGLVYGGNVVQEPRFYFNGSGPARLAATPTTELTTVLVGPFNNFGAPGAKSFHLGVPGYGQLNPYFGRMASSAGATVLGDALAQSPTFFTLSEIGGNDVLGYALSGGSGIDQTGNFDPTTYGGSDITDPNVFASVFSSMVTALTANGAKGVVANLPYITDLANFTTVPYNPLDPTGSSDSSVALAAQIPTLNVVYGGINRVFTALGETERVIQFSLDMANPVVIKDEDLTDLSAQITGGLLASPTFPAFVQQFGLPAQAAPLVASLFGQFYGQARPATSNDLLVLASSTTIGTVNTNTMQYLMSQGLSQTLAGQFSAEGVSLPLEDKWVITPQEQAAIKTATDAYNATISAVANANPNVALVDFNAVLTEASTGIMFDNYTLNTSLVTGGLVSLDGVHLTARGYALMANKILGAIDAKFGSNFTTATNGLAKAGDYPTNYSPALR